MVSNRLFFITIQKKNKTIMISAFNQWVIFLISGTISLIALQSFLLWGKRLV